MEKIKGICYLWLVSITLAFQANASISVIPNIINFSGSDLPRKDVIVINNAKEEAYIKITPHLVVNAGTQHERKVIIRNPEKEGLLVTPQQLIIPPQQRRLIRLMLTHPLGEQEHIYRIDIVPVAKDIVPRHPRNQQGKNMGLQLLVGYGVLAMARPAHPRMNLQIRREGKTLFLKNNGNANVELSDLKQCRGKTCFSIKNFIRLYAGNTSQLSLPFSAPVKMVSQLVDEQKTLTSN